MHFLSADVLQYSGKLVGNFFSTVYFCTVCARSCLLFWFSVFVVLTQRVHTYREREGGRERESSLLLWFPVRAGCVFMCVCLWIVEQWLSSCWTEWSALQRVYAPNSFLFQCEWGSSDGGLGNMQGQGCSSSLHITFLSVGLGLVLLELGIAGELIRNKLNKLCGCWAQPESNSWHWSCKPQQVSLLWLRVFVFIPLHMVVLQRAKRHNRWLGGLIYPTDMLLPTQLNTHTHTHAHHFCTTDGKVFNGTHSDRCCLHPLVSNDDPCLPCLTNWHDVQMLFSGLVVFANESRVRVCSLKLHMCITLTAFILSTWRHVRDHTFTRVSVSVMISFWLKRPK